MAANANPLRLLYVGEDKMDASALELGLVEGCVDGCVLGCVDGCVVGCVEGRL
jgi:hypothetical protein